MIAENNQFRWRDKNTFRQLVVPYHQGSSGIEEELAAANLDKDIEEAVKAALNAAWESLDGLLDCGGVISRRGVVIHQTPDKVLDNVARNDPTRAFVRSHGHGLAFRDRMIDFLAKDENAPFRRYNRRWILVDPILVTQLQVGHFGIYHSVGGESMRSCLQDILVGSRNLLLTEYRNRKLDEIVEVESAVNAYFAQNALTVGSGRVQSR